jgi:hypothetical protein
VLNLSEIFVRPAPAFEEQHFQQLMQEHHCLGAPPKISEPLWTKPLFVTFLPVSHNKAEG